MRAKIPERTAPSLSVPRLAALQTCAVITSGDPPVIPCEWTTSVTLDAKTDPAFRRKENTVVNALRRHEGILTHSTISRTSSPMVAEATKNSNLFAKCLANSMQYRPCP